MQFFCCRFAPAVALPHLPMLTPDPPLVAPHQGPLHDIAPATGGYTGECYLYVPLVLVVGDELPDVVCTSKEGGGTPEAQAEGAEDGRFTATVGTYYHVQPGTGVDHDVEVTARGG